MGRRRVLAYYNDNDPFVCKWLENLISAGAVAPGDVDCRPIEQVSKGDLDGYRQVHFFAGIGGWNYALRLAGWPDDRPVWTGSCPCQPFSAAGKRLGTADRRHLWPEFRRLISECNPASVFGEQVASKDGRLWLAGVRTDLEALGYGVGAADLCAAGVGAPHIRQRLYWAASIIQSGRGTAGERGFTGITRPPSSADDWVANANGGLAGNGYLQSCGQYGQQPQDGGPSDGMADAEGEQHNRRRMAWNGGYELAILCTDGKSRRVPANETGEPEPTLFPLAHGIPNRVGTLRGAGNAIVPQVAAEFVRAYLESLA